MSFTILFLNPINIFMVLLNVYNVIILLIILLLI